MLEKFKQASKKKKKKTKTKTRIDNHKFYLSQNFILSLLKKLSAKRTRSPIKGNKETNMFTSQFSLATKLLTAGQCPKLRDEYRSKLQIFIQTC